MWGLGAPTTLAVENPCITEIGPHIFGFPAMDKKYSRPLNTMGLND